MIGVSYQPCRDGSCLRTCCWDVVRCPRWCHWPSHAPEDRVIGERIRYTDDFQIMDMHVWSAGWWYKEVLVRILVPSHGQHKESHMRDHSVPRVSFSIPAPVHAYPRSLSCVKTFIGKCLCLRTVGGVTVTILVMAYLSIQS